MSSKSGTVSRSELATVGESTAGKRYDEFGRQEFNKKRKVIIRNTPIVTYAVCVMYFSSKTV